jgi:serine phosphatase RsbU (regulator of sigma subunit)
MKTLFVGTPLGEDFQALFRRFNKTLHAIGRDQIYMALGLLRLRGREVHAISAAVPPLFVWRSASGTVEIMALKGMFLGTEFEIPYEEIKFTLDPGDQVLLLSDGYLEQVGASHERLEEGRSATAFREVAGQPPEKVIDHLFRRLDEWREATPQGDDVTAVVIQSKG